MVRDQPYEHMIRVSRLVPDRAPPGWDGTYDEFLRSLRRGFLEEADRIRRDAELLGPFQQLVRLKSAVRLEAQAGPAPLHLMRDLGEPSQAADR